MTASNYIFGDLIAATPLDLWIGACTPCQRGVRVHHGTGNKYAANCPYCGQPVTVERIYGTVTIEPCHGKCMGAVGPQCSCACGGVNHGGAWEKTGQALASAVAAHKARLDKAAAEVRQRQDRKRREFDRWAEPHLDLIKAIHAGSYGNEFLADLANRLSDLMPLTDRQLDAAERSIARDAEYAARRARIDAQQAEFAASGQEVPSGKVTFAGQVLKLEYREGTHGPGSGSYKATILVDAGYRVWGTMPGALIDQARKETLDDRREWDGLRSMVGRRVELSATVTPENAGFGYFSRPKGKLL